MYVGKTKTPNNKTQNDKKCTNVEDTRMSVANKREMTVEELALYYGISVEEARNHKRVTDIVMKFFTNVKDNTLTALDAEWYKLCKHQFRKTKDIFNETESFMLCIRGMMNLNDFTIENIRQIIKFAHAREIKRLRSTNNPLFLSKRPLTHINIFSTLFSLLDDLDEARSLIDYCMKNKHTSYAKLYSLAITNKDFDDMCVELNLSWKYFLELVKRATRYAEDYHRKRRHERNMKTKEQSIK